MDTAVRLLGTPTAKLLELLVDVELVRIARKARLTEEHAQGLQLRYRTNHLEVNVLFEASTGGRTKRMRKGSGENLAKYRCIGRLQWSKWY